MSAFNHTVPARQAEGLIGKGILALQFTCPHGLVGPQCAPAGDTAHLLQGIVEHAARRRRWIRPTSLTDIGSLSAIYASTAIMSWCVPLDIHWILLPGKKGFPIVPGDCLQGKGIGCLEPRSRTLYHGEVVLPFFLGNPGGNGFDDPGRRGGSHAMDREMGIPVSFGERSFPDYATGRGPSLLLWRRNPGERFGFVLLGGCRPGASGRGPQSTDPLTVPVPLPVVCSAIRQPPPQCWWARVCAMAWSIERMDPLTPDFRFDGTGMAIEGDAVFPYPAQV